MGERIWVLPEELANQIAAGEVVERPASVVKELVENAIDAGAQSLNIEIQGSGKQLIRVEDDGSGMERDDALLAFERHATSKVRSSQDLRAVRTLGFRGEALPSIAAVSRLRLLTAARGDAAGTLVELEGGTVRRVQEAARAVGTTVEVKRLFFNTPARLKFLKTPLTEMSQISQVVTQLALAQVQVRLRMAHEGRVLLQLPSSRDLRSRLVALRGADFVQGLLPLELQDPYLRGMGFLSPPESGRGSSGHQQFFLNGRAIRSKALSRAVIEGYRPFLPRDRYPIAFLFLDLDPEEVDVNVHPAKAEVRLAREGKVQGLLQEAIRQTLTRHQRKVFPLSRLPELPAEREILPLPKTPPINGPVTDRTEDAQTSLRLPLQERADRRWIPIGQIQSSFILLETPEALLVLDQHAAHERVLYEDLREKLAHSAVPRQSLLGTVSLAFTQSEACLLGQHLEQFECLGFVLEPFGGETFLVRAVPAFLAGRDYERVLRDVVDRLAELGTVGRLEEIVEEMIRVIACHGAIKTPQTLQVGQIQALVERLQDLGPPYTCPHGRPILQSFTLDTIKKGFLRNR